jgi:beta-phosphoglucomutase
MLPFPQAILFDFDGVIVNSEPLHFQAFVKTLEEHGILLTELEYYAELIGFDDKGAFKYIFEKNKKPLDPKTFLEVMTRKSKLMMQMIEDKQFAALPGVEAFVRGLWRNYPLAICSGALREEIEAMLIGINLRDCFSIITAAEDVPVGKPDPMGYLQTVRQLAEKTRKKLTPANCLVVEDAPSVAKTVSAVGFPVLAVTTSYPADKLGDAKWVVDSLEPRVVKQKIPQLELAIG